MEVATGKATGKKKSAESTTTVTRASRAAISRERQLALALRAMLESTVSAQTATEGTEVAAKAALIDAGKAAETLLSDLGYGTLIGLPRQLADLENQLRIATVDKDYAAVTRLGRELERVKSGKPPKVKAVTSE